ncbi:MAG: hypothetical protein JJE25_03080 [Bacteroidia bacterium]|nr:hypothetical protein [Bacteroidia bacterium]
MAEIIKLLLLIIASSNIKLNMKKTKNIFTLKKNAAFFLILFVIGILASCKSHEKCPAYGKIQPVKQSTEKNS